MDLLRVLSSPDLEVRKKTLSLILDLINSRNVEEVGSVCVSICGRVRGTDVYVCRCGGGEGHGQINFELHCTCTCCIHLSKHYIDHMTSHDPPGGDGTEEGGSQHKQWGRGE